MATLWIVVFAAFAFAPPALAGGAKGPPGAAESTADGVTEDAVTEDGADGATPASPESDEAAKPAPSPAAPAVTPAEPAKLVEVGGYLQPSFSVVHRGAAVPRDRWRYGAESTRGGVIFRGSPIARWKYHLEVIVAGETADLVTAVDTVDTNGDGVADDVAPATERVPALFVERAAIQFDAGHGFSITAGELRIPFTVQELSPSTQLMFPGRSGPNEVFVQGPDLGIDAVWRLPGDRVVVHAGAFNGTGEPVDASAVHGLVYSGRVDLNPLGEFPVSEANTERRPLRVGLGAGALYYASQNYDVAGFPSSQQRDLRASASFRVAVRGLYVQSEVLRRQRTDSLSNRPEITTGAYAQGSWYMPLAIGVAPLARVGWAAEDQGFAERTTLWFEAGVAIYPSVEDPEALRLIIQYVGERRLTEAEQANGAVAQAQMMW